MQEFLSVAAMLITLAAVGTHSPEPTAAKTCHVQAVSALGFDC